MKDDHQTVELEGLLDECAAKYLRDPEGYILKDEGASDWVEYAGKMPFTDPALEDYGELLKLAKALVGKKLAVVRTHRRGYVGIFTVPKKDETQRLIFDCQITNWQCQDPPRSFLTTPAALAGMRLSDDALAEGTVDDERPYDGRVAALDLCNAFYLFWTMRLSDLFALPQPFRARDLCVTHAFGPDGEEVEVDPLS